MAATENGSGDKNQHGGFPTVATQKERADGVANSVNAFTKLSYVVGADWFQYYDEPPLGRKPDGEDYNFGLFDVQNNVYADVTKTFASLNTTKLKSAVTVKRSDATSGIPLAPRDPLADFQSMTALKGWDRENGFVPAATKSPTGDMYICWSPKALYLSTFVIDLVEPIYYRENAIPDSDRAKWTIQLNDQTPVTLRVGAGKDVNVDNPDVRCKSLSGTYHNNRCITAVEIPASVIDKSELRAGEQIQLKSTFDTVGRAERIEWQGRFVLRGDE
jgi:hypothetical protein